MKESKRCTEGRRDFLMSLLCARQVDETDDVGLVALNRLTELCLDVQDEDGDGGSGDSMRSASKDPREADRVAGESD